MKELIDKANKLKEAVDRLANFDVQTEKLVTEYPLPYALEHHTAADKLPAIRRHLAGEISHLGEEIQKASKL